MATEAVALKGCKGSEWEIISLSLDSMIPRVMQSCRTLRLSLCFPVCLMRTPLAGSVLDKAQLQVGSGSVLLDSRMLPSSLVLHPPSASFE